MKQVTVKLSTTEEFREKISDDFARALRVLFVEPEKGVCFSEGQDNKLQMIQKGKAPVSNDLGELAADLQRIMPEYQVGLYGMPETPIVELIHQG